MKALIPLLCTLFFIGCNDTIPTQNAPSVENTNVITPEVNTTSVDEPKAVIPEITPTITPPAKVESTPIVESKPVEKPVEKIKTEPKKPSTLKVLKEVKPQTEVKEKPAQADASALYREKCASCHGAKAEKPALGKSQVIAGWSASQIEDALHGYQAGSYGKEMKALMTGQAKSLSGEQIKSLAKYISTL
ncbi:MAG: c-type cytochrome [Sulfuricurvum sp.]|nr:c-type cytochrome [Sulfuricurvum sp.]